MRRELAEGYELDDDRGRVEVVREAVEHPEHRDLVWFLNTLDAHALYAKFGFEAPNDRTMVRPRRD